MLVLRRWLLSVAANISRQWSSHELSEPLDRKRFVTRAIVPDGTDAPAVADPITDYVPSARPGGRAPHVFFERDGKKTSTIDVDA